MTIMEVICAEGMARGVSSASPGIPFLQVPWPFLMLSKLALDVITQRITFFCPLPHPGLLLGPQTYGENMTFQQNVKVCESVSNC